MVLLKEQRSKEAGPEASECFAMWECVAGTTRPTLDVLPPKAVPHRECEVLCPLA